MGKKIPLDELQLTYAAKLRAIIEKRMENLPNLVDTALDKAAAEIVANAVGMKQDWHGRWEVDHCNGRRTAIANKLGDYALAEVEKSAPRFVEEFVKTPRLAAKVKRALQEEFESAYEHALRERLTVAAEAKAQEDADALLKTLYPEYGKGLP